VVLRNGFNGRVECELRNEKRNLLRFNLITKKKKNKAVTVSVCNRASEKKQLKKDKKETEI
jgi:hypothetical protein